MKRIVIMGATSGIGLKVAEMYATAGWLIGAAGRNEDSLNKLKERFPINIETKAIDVTHRDAPKALKELIDRLGGMDIYFHVSGVLHENPSLADDPETATLRTNVIGFARMIATSYKYFRSNNKRGQIAAITSIAGTKGIGELASYSASKRFQQNYLEALEQLACIQKVKIDFTDIRPGWTRTPLLDSETTYPLCMSIDEVAPLVVRAIRTRRRRVVIDRRWAMLTALWQLLPSSLWVKIPLNIS